MKKIKLILISVLIILSLNLVSASTKKWDFNIEGGIVLPGYNDVQIPNTEDGTRFSLKNDLKIDNKIYYRFRLSYSLGKKSALSLLYAPLTVKAKGVLKKPIDFNGTHFNTGTPVKGLYRFNSYRLTYKYRLVGKPKIKIWVGFTAKIRDAEVKIEDGSKISSKTNVGFVPLLHLDIEWLWGRHLGLLFEADALAAKQGRAEDVSTAIFYKTGKNIKLKFGYRFVEGGADVEEVYNFAMLNYLYGGITFTF